MSIGSAIIGALRVNLGLDSAAFTAGLKVAKGDLSGFSKFAATSMVALTGVAVGLASAFGVAAKSAIDHADAMSKMAQKAGVSTEALSRLAYAANFSEVSLEDTTASLAKLSKTMADAAQNTKGTAASAFAALGINVKDANGNLRDADQVFTDIADRFSRIEDGATKTALAQALFGKSGAQLIPVLNEGAAGLKKYADESDRVGNTISEKFAQDANRFNDSLTTISGVLKGVIYRIVGSDGFLDGLNHISTLLNSPGFAQGAERMANAVIGALDRITTAIGNLVGAWGTLDQKLAPIGGIGGLLRTNPIFNAIGAGFDMMGQAAQTGPAFDTGGWGSGAFKPSNTITVHGGQTDAPPAIDLSKFTDGLGKAQQAIDPFEARVSELSDALTATVDPFSQMKTDLTDLQTMFDHGRISAAQFGDAVVKTAAGGVGAIADLAGGLTSALSDMFKENKAIAVANAIVNGIGSVAKTFETYGATPWGFAAAGIAAATAAANVASILSTNENSTSVNAAGASGAAVAPGGASSSINLTIRGSGMISVDDIADQLTKSISKGGNQALVKVIRAT